MMNESDNPRASRLKTILDDLKGVEQNLPVHAAEKKHQSDCDDWCKLWMLLVGAWYALSWAENYLEEEPLSKTLPEAHRYASNIEVTLPSHLVASELNTWHTGFFLISAEHRIADVMHRLCKLFLDSGEQVDKCCARLLAGCPRCNALSILPSADAVVRDFMCRVAYPGKTPLGLVFNRVNVVKHGPTADPVDSLSTATRWDHACEALASLLKLFGDLTVHVRQCRRPQLRRGA